MDIITGVAIEIGTVVITSLLLAIIAPFARRLRRVFFVRMIKRSGTAATVVKQISNSADQTDKGV